MRDAIRPSAQIHYRPGESFTGVHVRDGWGWSGSVTTFLEQSDASLIGSLSQHHAELQDMPPSGSQRDAWNDQLQCLRIGFRRCLELDPGSSEWGLVLEYELPLEGGRRPDVVVLSGGSISVVEHKSPASFTQAWVDQVGAYARDLGDYHEQSHGKPITPILLLGSGGTSGEVRDDVIICGPDALGDYLVENAQPGQLDLDGWLRSPYAPLPTLVAAARRLFEQEPLPHVRTALAAGIPATLDLLERLTNDAKERGRRLLVFVTGVPGAGKTLVGLRYVYERSHGGEGAIFLSGNGPLVQVLQDALGSRVFVRDLHAYIKRYGLDAQTPNEPIVVFDEAQRAWDRGYMQEKRGSPHSEPDLLIQTGQRLPTWASFVGLVGTGQEIHSGEEGGIEQWSDAVTEHGDSSWDVHLPEQLASAFADLAPSTHPQLDLDRTLRSRRAEQLHDWVRLLLEGSLALAARKAQPVHQAGFVVYLTRELDEARRYGRARYEGQPDARYGLLASSHAKRLQKDFGIQNGFMATSRMNIAKWFNAPPEDPKSGCQLDQPVTEFQCQGLEVDLPVVCWGDDLTWDGERWHRRAINRRYPLEDPDQILTNTYRVLLTRGRDGVIIWVPPAERWDPTELALLSAGARPMPEDSSLAGVVDAQRAAEERAAWRENGA